MKWTVKIQRHPRHDFISIVVCLRPSPASDQNIPIKSSPSTKVRRRKITQNVFVIYFNAKKSRRITSSSASASGLGLFCDNGWAAFFTWLLLWVCFCCCFKLLVPWRKRRAARAARRVLTRASRAPNRMCGSRIGFCPLLTSAALWKGRCPLMEKSRRTPKRPCKNVFQSLSALLPASIFFFFCFNKCVYMLHDSIRVFLPGEFTSLLCKSIVCILKFSLLQDCTRGLKEFKLLNRCTEFLYFFRERLCFILIFSSIWWGFYF